MSFSQKIKESRRLRESNPKHEYPMAPRRAITRLAAVTCHYNPMGYRRIEENYFRFVENLPKGLELWTIELAYGSAPFRLPDGPRMIRACGTFERHLLWQKERLLNLAIQSVPKSVDAIAWLDADLIWLNRDWLEDATSLLEHYNVVQLFEHVTDTDAKGRFGHRNPSHVYARNHGLPYGRPGGAWAARREAIAGGLYDRHVLGGGDSTMMCGWEGRDLPPGLEYGPASEEHYREWADEAQGLVQCSLASVPGDVLHLYHGTRENRRYVERYKILREHAFDPQTDVEIDPDIGILQWSDFALAAKPDMVRQVADYFQDRREDD